jgi:hypothetical protein
LEKRETSLFTWPHPTGPHKNRAAELHRARAAAPDESGSPAATRWVAGVARVSRWGKEPDLGAAMRGISLETTLRGDGWSAEGERRWWRCRMVMVADRRLGEQRVDAATLAEEPAGPGNNRRSPSAWRCPGRRKKPGAVLRRGPQLGDMA